MTGNNPWLTRSGPWQITRVARPLPGAEEDLHAETVGPSPAGADTYRVACLDCDDWASGPHATRRRCDDLARQHHADAHASRDGAA